MKLPHNPHKIAGLLSAVLILPFWYILLFVAQPSNVPIVESTTESLRYMFSSENPARAYIYWHAFAPLATAVFGGSYLFGVSRSKPGATILLTLSLALGVSAFFFSNFAIAFWVSLPCYWAYLSLSSHHSSGTH
jgi:hypothetical protein